MTRTASTAKLPSGPALLTACQHGAAIFVDTRHADSRRPLIRMIHKAHTSPERKRGRATAYRCLRFGLVFRT